MNCLRIVNLGSVLKGIKFIVALGLMLSPAGIHAETLNLMYALETDVIRAAPAGKIAKKPAELLPFLGMDERGDVVIKSGKVSLVVAYNTADDVQRYQDRVRDIQPLDSPLMNGVSLRICCLF